MTNETTESRAAAGVTLGFDLLEHQLELPGAGCARRHEQDQG
jgi:hypothetical protein